MPHKNHLCYYTIELYICQYHGVMIFSARQLKIPDFGAFKKSCGYNPVQPRSYVAKKEFVGQYFYIFTSFFSTFLIILFALSKIASSRSLLYKLSISFKPDNWW